MHGGTINKVGKAGSKKTGTVLQKWKSTLKTTRAIGSLCQHLQMIICIFDILRNKYEGNQVTMHDMLQCKFMERALINFYPNDNIFCTKDMLLNGWK